MFVYDLIQRQQKRLKESLTNMRETRTVILMMQLGDRQNSDLTQVSFSSFAKMILRSKNQNANILRLLQNIFANQNTMHNRILLLSISDAYS